MEILKVDICIIGAGSGGLSVAAGTAQLGAKVALIESGKMGGDCLNYGCIPSKALLSAAKRANVFRSSEAFGIDKAEPQINFEEVHHHIHEVIANLSPQDSVERFEKLGVQVIQAKAYFLSPTLLQAGNFQIQAKYFVIATGSSPAIPSLPGIDSIPYLTNETIFNLKEKPEHLIVLGGGPIGCELAQAYQLLGVRTTILEAFTLLPKEDDDVVNILRHRLKADGIEILEGAKVLSVSHGATGLSVNVSYEGKEVLLQGSHLLIATGRKPNLNDLGLKEAKVEYNQRTIEVDSYLRSSNKKIYAIGDVIGPYQFTHMAAYHAQIVIKNCLFHFPSKVRYRATPWVTFTDPEVAHVGISSKDSPLNSKTLVWPYKDCDRAQTERETEGFIKVSTTQKGQILGVSIIGAHAGELILPWCLAIEQKLKIRSLADLIVPYPTLSEINKKVAGSFYTPLLFSPFTRKLVKFFMKVIP